MAADMLCYWYLQWFGHFVDDRKFFLMHHPDGWEAQDLPINATGSGGYRHLQFDNSPGQSRVQLYTTDQDSGLTNVTVPEIAAPKMLNKKRVAKGKQPFFSYRVLQIEAPRGESDRRRWGSRRATGAFAPWAYPAVGGAYGLGPACHG